MSLQSTTQLKSRLRAIAKRERQVVVLSGIAKVLIALAVFSAAFFLVDWLFVLPVAARLLLLLGGLCAAGWVAKTDLRDPLRERRDEITTALKIEKRFPELRDRLISVVQLADGAPGASPELLARLELDTAQMATPLNFADVINWRFLRKILLIAGAILAVGIFSGVIFPQYVATTFRRMFFGDVRYPSLTRIEVRQAPTRLVQGADWTLEVKLAGRIPSLATLKIRNVRAGAEGGRKWTSVPLRPIVGYTYGVTLEKVPQSFEYQVLAGDAWTEPQVVQVQIPVAVLDPLLDVQPPAYSGLPALKDEPLAGATVMEGATVTLRVPTTKPLTKGALLTAAGETLSLTPLAGGSGAAATFIVALAGGPAAPTSGVLVARNGVASFTVRVKDTEGLENPEPRVLYSLRVQKDQLPKVRLVSPKSDRISVPYAEWKIAYEADDDFGVRAAWLAWEARPTVAGDGARADEGPGDADGAAKPLREGRIPLQGIPDALRWEGQSRLDMVAARTTPGETLTVWVEVADARGGVTTNGLPGPESVGRSQPLQFMIVDENAKWEEIQKRLGTIEEEVVNLQDRQEGVKKAVEGLKR
jgi:hypothetical protein